MDLLSTISGIGGIGGVTLGVAFIIYKCCKGRRLHTRSGCIDINLSAEVTPDNPHPHEDSKEDV